MPSSARCLTAAAGILVAGISGGPAALAQGGVGQPQRVSDLNPTPVVGPGDIPREHGLAVAGDHLYYAGDGASTGVELYRAQISAAGIELVADIHPGPGDSHPFAFVEHRGRLFCFADDGGHGFELWVTDGTAAGTRMVRDLYPGLASTIVPQPGEAAHARGGIGIFGGQVWFCAADGGRDLALFRSDGTALGTQRVRTLGAWRRRTPMQQFTVIGNRACFLAGDDVVGGYRLWVTDGSASGTRAVLDLPGADGVAPFRLDPFDGRLALTGTGEMWVIDPVTAKVEHLVRGSGLVHSGFGTLPDPTTPRQSLFFFSAGTALWKSDGTAAGTVRFMPIRGPGVLNSYVQDPVVAAGRLYFYGFDLQAGEELWASDGSVLGTGPVIDLRAGPLGSTGKTGFGRERRLVTSGQLVYFAADDGKSGLELWVSDGSAAGTAQVGDLHAGPSAATPRAVTPINNAGVAFVADHGGSRPGLWLFQPQPRVLRRAAANFVTHAPRTVATRLRDVTVHDDTVFWSGDDGRHGNELWASDGSPAGTRLVRDLRAGGSALRHHDLINGGSAGGVHGVAVGKDLYFTGYQAAGRLALFRSDGSSNGTQVVRQLDLNGARGWPLRGVGVGTALYSHGFHRGQGEGVFRFDAAGNMNLLARLQPGQLQRLGARLLLTDGTPPNLRGVWGSDGTASGTVPLVQFARPLFGPFCMVQRGRRAVFAVNTRGGELWSTDGTPPGTRLLRRVGVRSLTVVDDVLYALEDRGTDVALTRGDGTVAGTSLVLGKLPLTSQGLCAVGGRVFFTGYTAQSSELWVSDGRASGTRRLRSFPSQRRGVPILRHMLAAGSRHLFFQLDTSDGLGTELWVSDGTSAGTATVADLRRGPESGNSGRPVQARGRVWFHGDDGRGGSIDGDLWNLPVGAVAYAVGHGCAADGFPPRMSGTDPVRGGSVDLRVRGRAGTAGLMFLGDPLTRALELGSGCRLFLDPSRSFVTGLRTDATGAWSLRKVPVPNLPALVGARLVAQTALGNSPQPPLGVELSNALLLVVGD